MLAVVIHQFGDPKQLKAEEVRTPEPRGDQALVEVKAAGINPSDVKNVQGAMHGTTLPRIPGRDFAGVVVRGPADVIGREVWGTGGDVGFTQDGSHAQYILIPLAALTPKPAKISMEAAGSAGLVFVTAWSALVTAAQVSKGDTVLIIGAAGGVGSAAVQIARSRGGKVVGVVRNEEDIARARENGADEVINSSSGNLTQGVSALTKGAGANVVFDTSGLVFAESVEAAAMGGRVAVITAPADGKATFNLRSVYRKELRVLGVDTRRLDVVACASLLTEMKSGFEAGAFKSEPGAPFALEQASEAYQQSAGGKGRVYLRPNG